MLYPISETYYQLQNMRVTQDEKSKTVNQEREVEILWKVRVSNIIMLEARTGTS